MSSFLASLSSLDSVGRLCTVTVPQSLVQSVDEGRNVEWLLRDQLIAAVNSNDGVRGEIAAAHALKEAITQWTEAVRQKQTETAGEGGEGEG